MSEVWRDIEGYIGVYQVSSLGRVRSLGKPFHPGKVRKPAAGKNGYLFLGLHLNKIVKVNSVHRLVAKAFHPDKWFWGAQVNHINSVRYDNRPENLEWVTASQNQYHSSKHGKLGKGSKHWNSTLTEKDVSEIRKLLKAGMVQRRIAEKFGVAYPTISTIKNGKWWKHV